MTVRDFIVQDYQDRKGRIGYISYNWYRATGQDGLTVTFRFPKGGDPKYFDLHVNNNQLVNVDGPFKTRKAAHIGR